MANGAFILSAPSRKTKMWREGLTVALYIRAVLNESAKR